MGQGGSITLVNGTRYDWDNTHQHSYQMNSWGFPNIIPAGTSATVYVEWDEGIFDTTSDDAGEVVYNLNSTDLGFQVQARANNGFNLQAVFTNFSTPNNSQGSTINLGWNHDGSVNFILSGEVNNFTSSNLPTSWMHDNLNMLGNRNLRQLCIPGFHDAGMSTLSSGTAFAFPCNTITQTTGILGQLQAGARYFDIRPVISAGQYFTGHYGHIDQINSWQGANGQSIGSIINDINTYTATNKELVILYLSHDLNTDLGNNSYASFTQSEWDALFAQLRGINNLFVAQPTTVDLTTLTLNTFIGGNSAAVIVIVEPSSSGISLANYANKGFYLVNNFPVYNNYSDTNDLNQMISDQLSKMKAQRPNPSASYFLLSWTLTQNNTEASTCQFGTASSILDLANTANPKLYSQLLNACSDQCYPNIIYCDNIQSSDIAALAMAVNNKCDR
ncbi:hypothetical protein [Microcystis aeruginosa]|uniref:1-phosphatidylinositol phosphodiesterase n=1 Tax=Microcystis aeruginosa NIES-2521 TaxID=2303983 RepID=A0A5A5S4M4_MICAE|nr:hypothetical protein [Microcystis aeruginosa]GCA81799.1 1-phosphatidylinositol phosphodiesterase [Microcystis aeruginosa NIES-2521]